MLIEGFLIQSVEDYVVPQCVPTPLTAECSGFLYPDRVSVTCFGSADPLVVKPDLFNGFNGECLF
jgi:hypothetical protein